MKVLVCGGRNFANWAMLSRALDQLHRKTPIALLVHGAAPGADTLARRWAVARGVPETGGKYFVDWDAERAKDPIGFRSAGPKRNLRMLTEERPSLVVAFPTGGPGTANCTQFARRLGIEVREVNA